jgi:hypothetical protein
MAAAPGTTLPSLIKFLKAWIPSLIALSVSSRRVLVPPLSKRVTSFVLLASFLKIVTYSDPISVTLTDAQ